MALKYKKGDTITTSFTILNVCDCGCDIPYEISLPANDSMWVSEKEIEDSIAMVSPRLRLEKKKEELVKLKEEISQLEQLSLLLSGE